MKTDFVNQLRALGFNPQEPAADKVYFEWLVEVGPNAGKRVLVGTTVGNGFPATQPSAPHFKALDSDWKEHTDNVNPSEFGNGWSSYPDNDPALYQKGWRYWSRRFDEWAATNEKNAKFYLAHLRKIMMSI